MLRNRPFIRYMIASGALLLAAGCGGYPLNTQVDCGNGVVDGVEECDALDLGGATCESLGWEGGALACGATCTYDTDLCEGTGPECGNDALEYGEDCDGADLGGVTCSDLGFVGGALGCTSACTFDTSACSNAGTCGDGTLDPGEECDGANLDGHTCESLGWDGGTLACGATCTFDESGCADIEPYCGDGAVNTAIEECDGADLGGATCQTLGWDGGALGCSLNCAFDESACFMAQPYCGDGAINTVMEECDGADLGGMTCESLGYDGGSLVCSPQCRLDPTGCFTIQPICGNGVVNPPMEDCDGFNLDGETCQSLGYAGGTLACTVNCTFDTSGCTAAPTCSPTGGTLTCNMATTDTNVGAPDQVDDWYNCVTFPLTGPEVVYTFVQTGGILYQNITVDVGNLGADLDLLILTSNGGGCDPALSCAAHSANPQSDPEQATFQYTPGATYYIVVDGYEGATSGYDISVTCSN